MRLGCGRMSANDSDGAGLASGGCHDGHRGDRWSQSPGRRRDREADRRVDMKAIAKTAPVLRDELVTYDSGAASSSRPARLCDPTSRRLMSVRSAAPLVVRERFAPFLSLRRVASTAWRGWS